MIHLPPTHTERYSMWPFSGFKQKSGFRKSCKTQGTPLQRRLHNLGLSSRIGVRFKWVNPILKLDGPASLSRCDACRLATGGLVSAVRFHPTSSAHRVHGHLKVSSRGPSRDISEGEREGTKIGRGVQCGDTCCAVQGQGGVRCDVPVSLSSQPCGYCSAA